MSLSASEKELMRRWVETWKRAGPELERIKEEDLRAMTDEEAVQQATQVMAMAGRWLESNPGYERESGLVEQQRWFKKWKHPV
ncbi:MAG: hypothetical protein HC904_08780 [Blastochloris sp.]|nr:hypothetical protein [Blastochloris sp.]